MQATPRVHKEYIEAGRARLAQLDALIAAGLGDTPPEPEPPILQTPAPVARPSQAIAPVGIPMTPRDRILEASYKRRACFICGQFGWCEHREQKVELVIAQFVGIGGELE